MGLQLLWRWRRPIGRGVKIAGIGLLLLLAFGLLTRETGREWLLDRMRSLTATVYRSQPSPVVIVERLQAMRRLETARQTTMHDVAVGASNGLPVWLAGERLRMRVVAETSAGIDLSQLKPEHVQISGRRVRITLPEPQIFDIVLRESGTEVYHRERGWLNFHPDKQIEQRARLQAWQEAHQAASQGELLHRARINAADELQRLLKMLDFEQVQIDWQTAHAK
ncbi:MAG: hypothetical protein CFK49_10965 [Armatimonadetes bacterium JP3_11]|nr:MAG: hypothetical protein CFK48_03725 [Armatimonadetes bacterium CP1_7O]OYT72307.1 MAG: hypothetical protein CFK49_10965 [Armatimonadetes bacterium JP3_11]RMH09364.1 MAG: DUF4230 domain-containing protein [Armatimonadota bacterium]